MSAYSQSATSSSQTGSNRLPVVLVPGGVPEGAESVPVVLDAVTCPECDGYGDCEGCDLPGPDVHPPWRCPRCDGVGTVPPTVPEGPIGLVEEQCRAKPQGLDQGSPWRFRPECVNDKNDALHERRQRIVWVADKTVLLPVVDQDHPIAGLHFDDGRSHNLVMLDEDTLWDVTDEPWAAGLRPGQFVLLCSELRQVEPITERRCTCAEHGPVGGGMVVNTHCCPAWHSKSLVPLDVPAGAVHTVEVK